MSALLHTHVEVYGVVSAELGITESHGYLKLYFRGPAQAGTDIFKDQ